MSGPLEGVRVLDLTRVLSGPACGRYLADLGADVIKVEAPDGDVARTVRPLVDGASVYFAQANAGKRNVCVDIEAPGGAGLLVRLAERSDVLLENFRPGVLDRHGLGPAQLAERNPRLVYCSINGYGYDGPWAGRRAYAPLVHAESGTLELGARRRRTDVLPEVQSHGDVYPALVGANAILAALFERERTGRGAHVDVSMAEVLLYTNEWTAVELQGYEGEQLFGAWNSLICPLASGRSVAFAGNPVFTFPAWARAMGREELLETPEFARIPERLGRRDEILRMIREFVSWFETVEDLEKAVEPYGLSAGEVRTIPEITSSKWAADRRVLFDAGGYAIPRAPYRSSASEVGARGAAASRGQHNSEVLAEVLGLTPDELASLESSGVLSEQ